MPALPAGAEDYDTGDGFDEAFEAPGVVREHYLEVLESLAETGPGARRAGRRGAAARVERRGSAARTARSSWSTRCRAC